MEMRELSLPEMHMVSGAGIDWTLQETTDNFKSRLDFLMKAGWMFNPSNPQAAIAEIEPLRNAMVSFLNEYGLDGEATMKMWGAAR